MQQLRGFYRRRRLLILGDLNMLAVGVNVSIGFALWPNKWASFLFFAAGASAVFAFICVKPMTVPSIVLPPADVDEAEMEDHLRRMVDHDREIGADEAGFGNDKQKPQVLH